VFDPLWLTPREALRRYLDGQLNLPPPTVATIEDLEAERLRALATLRDVGKLPSIADSADSRRPGGHAADYVPVAKAVSR
jgi:hypothetical protein